MPQKTTYRKGKNPHSGKATSNAMSKKLKTEKRHTHYNFRGT
jgi:hypothetical protein